MVEHVIDCVARGAAEAGRSLDEIEIWWMLKPYLARSEEEAWRDLAWTLAGTANHLFRFSMEDKFVPEELQEPSAAASRLRIGHPRKTPRVPAMPSWSTSSA